MEEKKLEEKLRGLVIFTEGDGQGQATNTTLEEELGEHAMQKVLDLFSQELDRAREEGRKHMQGWECPKCGSVYSPLTFECTSCKNSGIKVRTSDKTSGYDNTSYLN